MFNRRRNQGFTLIEALVAFAVFVIALGALLTTFSSAMRSIDVVNRTSIATMLAKSILDDVGSEIPIAAGEQSGEIQDGFSWTVRISPAPDIPPVQRREDVLAAYLVEAEVSWESKPVFSLTTLRLASEAQEFDRGGLGGSPDLPE